MDLKNKLVMPLRVKVHTGDTLEVLADPNCPEDQVLMIDKDGHVHKFINVGRLIDRVGEKFMREVEARMEKYKRLEEAGQELLKYLPNMEVLGAARYSAHLKTAMCFRDALKELEQE